MKIEEGVLRVFQRCFKGIKGFKLSRVVQASFRCASIVFQDHFKEVNMCFKCFNDA